MSGSSDDLLKAASVLCREAALVSQQARRPAPEDATVGIVEAGARVRTCGLCGSTTAVREYDENLDVCEECLLEEPPTLVERPCPRCGGRGYHHGFGEHGYDPDWCEFCGGQGVVFEEEA